MKNKCPNCSYVHAVGNQTTCDLKCGMPISPADWEWLNCREFEAAAKVAVAKVEVQSSEPAVSVVEAECGDNLESLFFKCGTFDATPQVEEEEGWI